MGHEGLGWREISMPAQDILHVDMERGSLPRQNLTIRPQTSIKEGLSELRGDSHS